MTEVVDRVEDRGDRYVVISLKWKKFFFISPPIYYSNSSLFREMGWEWDGNTRSSNLSTVGIGGGIMLCKKKRGSGLHNVFLPTEFLLFLGLKEGPDYRGWVQETEERVATFPRSPDGSLLAGMPGRGGG